MKIKPLMALLLAAALTFSFSSCGKRPAEEEENLPPEVSENDELVIYHSSKDLAPGLISLTEEYSKATGKTVSAKLYGSDFEGEISSGKAALYVVDTESDLEDWHSGGFFADLMNDTDFSNVISKIPAGLQLNNTGLGSYGIPLMLEAYGYIFDREMMASLFGDEAAEKIIDDLKTCSYSDFEGFVSAVKNYISSPSEEKITLNENSYTFKAEKSGKALNLTGVFALSSESFGAHKALLSAALSPKFSGRYEIFNADEAAVSSLEKNFGAFVDVLDLHSRNIAGTEGEILRGEAFSEGGYNYSTAVDLFARGNALFYPGSTAAAEDFEKSVGGIGDSLDIIPMKLPLSEEDFSAAGMTKEKLDRSIIIKSRYYLAVNPKAEEKLSAAAKEFISWLYEDEAGKTAYSSAFGTVPHSFEYVFEGESFEESESEIGSSVGEQTRAGIESENPAAASSPTPSHKIKNPLYESVARYYAEGNWIPDMTSAFDEDWDDGVLEEGISDFFGAESFGENERKSFIGALIDGWKNRLGNKNGESENVG